MTTTQLDEKIMKQKWYSKKASTKNRVDKNGNPIEFLLTFEDYYDLYNTFGKYPSATHVLCRKDDLGHYEKDNVYVAHYLDNLSEAHGLTSDLDKKINEYCKKTGYKRRIVKSMLKRNELVL